MATNPPRLIAKVSFFLFSFLLSSIAVDGHGHFSMGAQMIADDFSNHPCRRACVLNDEKRVCEYQLHVAWYVTMSRACFYCPNVQAHCSLAGCIPGSGSQRAIVAANRCLPGPSIEVCLGDRIRVNVVNMMQNGETVTIHWHGLHHHKTPYMDGVAMITQCPIAPGTNFTYEFEADMAGTYFWHSHTGMQRADGLAGALIIRHPDDPHRTLYDKDDLSAVMIQDWFPNETATNRFATYNYGNANFNPPQILINGIWPTWGVTGGTNLTLPPFPVALPPFEIVLDAQYRYRLRIISNAFWLTPVQIGITGHNLVVIASDGQPIMPVAARSITIMPAERFDVVPYFTGEDISPDGIYWLTVKGLGDADSAASFAKFVYKDGTNPKPTSSYLATDGAYVEPVLADVNYWEWSNYATNDAGLIGRKISQLRSISNRKRIARRPDVKFIVEFDFELVEDHRLYPIQAVRQDGPEYSYFLPSVFVTPRLNKITHKMPPVPLLTQFKEIPNDMFCNAGNRKCESHEFCECIHRVEIPLGSLVEIVLLDNGFSDETHDLNHAMHIHGYHFRVVGMGKVHLNLTAADFTKLDEEGQIERNLFYAPLKDVVGVPAGGYTIVRFVADNPGSWLLHCHIDFHMEMGMAMVLQVGEPSDLPPIPVDFPRCQSSWPDINHSPSSDRDGSEEGEPLWKMIKFAKPSATKTTEKRAYNDDYNYDDQFSLNDFGIWYR